MICKPKSDIQLPRCTLTVYSKTANPILSVYDFLIRYSIRSAHFNNFHNHLTHTVPKLGKTWFKSHEGAFSELKPKKTLISIQGVPERSIRSNLTISQ